MPEMTPRERVITAFTRGLPDRVPKHATFTPIQLRQAQVKTGFENPADALGFEIRTVSIRPPREQPDFSPFLPPNLPASTTSDEWGLTEIPGTFYHFTEYVYPMVNLADPRELDDWLSPDYTPLSRFAGIPEEITEWHRQAPSCWVV